LTKQAPLESDKDRARKRLEYLRKKDRANSMRCLGYTVCVTAGLTVAGCIGSGLAELSEGHLSSIPLLLGAGLSVGIAYAGGVMAVRAKERSAAILYVPPVRHQITTLPAIEVLLRGADAPAAASDELLRAASGSKTVSNELLRSTTTTVREGEVDPTQSS